MKINQRIIDFESSMNVMWILIKILLAKSKPVDIYA